MNDTEKCSLVVCIPMFLFIWIFIIKSTALDMLTSMLNASFTMDCHVTKVYDYILVQPICEDQCG